MKLRILEGRNGLFMLQKKGWFFWHNVDTYLKFRIPIVEGGTAYPCFNPFSNYEMAKTAADMFYQAFGNKDKAPKYRIAWEKNYADQV